MTKNLSVVSYISGAIHHTGFPKWDRLVGDNLEKMAKNCMKMTKSAFLGQNSRGGHGGGDKPIFGVVGGNPPSPPH